MKHIDLQSVLIISAFLILGLAIGIGLCKFVSGFWEFVREGLV